MHHGLQIVARCPLQASCPVPARCLRSVLILASLAAAFGADAVVEESQEEINHRLFPPLWTWCEEMVQGKRRPSAQEPFLFEFLLEACAHYYIEDMGRGRAWIEPCMVWYKRSAEETTAGDLAECERLNRLELLADAAESFSVEVVKEFKVALHSWRQRRLTRQPGCRVVSLGEALCRRGNSLKSRWAGTALSSHLNGMIYDEACMCFSAFHVPRFWKSLHFWSHEETAPERWFLDGIVGDPEYESFYAKAGHLAPPYGAAQVPRHAWSGGNFSSARLNNLHRLRILRSAVPDFEIGSLSQVVELGGDCGDFAAVLLDLGFAGTHFVVNSDPMLVYINYWHRYSGIPSFFGSALPQTVAAVKGSIVLEQPPPLGTSFEAHLDRTEAANSLLISRFVYEHLDIEWRLRIWDMVKDFGIILLMLPGSDVVTDTMLGPVGQDLKRTHRVWIWRLPYSHPDHWWLLAVHESRQKPLCVPELNCGPDTLSDASVQ